MVPRRVIFLTALIAGLCVSLTVFADQGPLHGNVDARLVVTQDDGREVFLPADKAHPKDVIEYRLTYTNKGEAPLRNITIVDPVPEGTDYLVRTATKPNEGAVEFSIDDGKTYNVWPIRVKKMTDDGKEVEVEASPDMITHIRWIIDGDFEPKNEITLSYRTVVN